MLIKGVTPKGDPIPYTAQEAIRAALERAAKSMNTMDVIYWIDWRTIKLDKISSLDDKDGQWEAWAEGHVDLGKTVAKTDAFHLPKRHTFKVHYKLGKDSMGIPDIEIVDPPQLTPVETDPSKLAGAVPVRTPDEPIVGELTVRK